uniref:Putative secreted protein n=1 Tax=Ixodes ricinus TaxID=34613 RepID=A0A147BBS1_IXORI
MSFKNIFRRLLFWYTLLPLLNGETTYGSPRRSYVVKRAAKIGSCTLLARGIAALFINKACGSVFPLSTGERTITIDSKIALNYGTEITSSRECAICSDRIFTEHHVPELVIRCVFLCSAR